MPHTPDEHTDAGNRPAGDDADPGFSAQEVRRSLKSRLIKWLPLLALALFGLWLLDQWRLSRLDLDDAIASLEYGTDRARCHGWQRTDARILEYWHHRTARLVLTRLAHEGDAEAAYHLARMYMAGIGTLRDGGRALRWAHYAAAKRHVPAYTMLGHMYHSGSKFPFEGLVENPSESWRWHRKAADLGETESSVAYGILLLTHPDGTDYATEIRALLESAASDESLLAGIALAEAFEAGRFGQVDPAETLRWSLWSGLQGHKYSLENAHRMLMGEYWRDDKATPESRALVDLEAAYKWLLVSHVWYEREYLRAFSAHDLPEFLLENYSEEEHATYVSGTMVETFTGQTRRQSPDDNPMVRTLAQARSELNERVVAALSPRTTSSPSLPQFDGLRYRISEAAMQRAEGDAREFLIENPQPPPTDQIYAVYPSGRGGAFQAPLYCSDWRADFLE